MRSLPLALLALTLACGDKAAAPPASAARPKGPYADSPLVGRWSGVSRTLEFLADGTLVDLVWFDVERSTRQEDGTFETEIVEHFECRAGSFRVEGDRIEYDLLRVGSDVQAKGGWTWTIAGTTLQLGGDAQPMDLIRDDPDISPAAQALVGLWRRDGKISAEYADLGLLFTPGGLMIVVGKCSRGGIGWGVSSIGWLCTFSTYEALGEKLEEVEPNHPDRPRSHPFKLEGDRLTFGPMRAYDRVRGVLPLDGKKLDLDAWKAMK